MRIRILLVLLICSFCSCVESPDNIIGRWGQNRFVNLEITKDKQFIRYVVNGNDTVKFSFIYKLSKDNGIFLFSDTITKQPISYCKYHLENNRLYLWNYKGKEISDHIDEIRVEERIGKGVALAPESKDTLKAIRLCFDDNIIGNVMINFNVESGQGEINENNLPVILIDSTRLVRTKYKEDPVQYAKENVLIYQKKKESYTHIPFLYYKKGHSTDFLKEHGYNLDSVYVYFYGFNQARREQVEKAFGKTIKANVLMLRIDTLRKMLLNPYLGEELILYEKW